MVDGRFERIIEIQGGVGLESNPDATEAGVEHKIESSEGSRPGQEEVRLSLKAVNRAVIELGTYGVNIRPYSAASLTGLRFLASSGEIDLDPNIIIVVLCTEGKRGYITLGADS